MADMRYTATLDDRGVAAGLQSINAKFATLAAGGNLSKLGQLAGKFTIVGAAAAAVYGGLKGLGAGSEQAEAAFGKVSDAALKLAATVSPVGMILGTLYDGPSKQISRLAEAYDKLTDSVGDYIREALDPEISATRKAQDERQKKINASKEALDQLKTMARDMGLDAADTAAANFGGDPAAVRDAAMARLAAKDAEDRAKIMSLGQASGRDPTEALAALDARTRAQESAISDRYNRSVDAKDEEARNERARLAALEMAARVKAEELADERELVSLRAVALAGDETAAKLGEIRLRQAQRRREIERQDGLTPSQRAALLVQNDQLGYEQARLARLADATAQLDAMKTGVKTASVGTGLSLSSGVLGASLAVGVSREQLAKLKSLETEIKAIRQSLTATK